MTRSKQSAPRTITCRTKKLTTTLQLFTLLILTSSWSTMFCMSRAISVHQRLLSLIKFQFDSCSTHGEQQIKLVKILIPAWNPTSNEIQELVKTIHDKNKDDFISFVIQNWNSKSRAILCSLTNSMDLSLESKHWLASIIIQHYNPNYPDQAALIDQLISELPSDLKDKLVEDIINYYHADHRVRLDTILKTASNNTKYLTAHQIIEKKHTMLATQAYKIIEELSLDNSQKQPSL